MSRCACHHCGEEILSDAAFCIDCGSLLRQIDTGTTRLLNGMPRAATLPISQLVAGLGGVALLALLLVTAYSGAGHQGLDRYAWLFVLFGGTQLVQYSRQGRPWTGLRAAVMCAGITFGMVTRAIITSVVIFGGATLLVAFIELLAVLWEERATL